MRVYGNIIPLTVELLPFATPGKVDVRLRENISQIDSNMYVYDEYSILTYDDGTLEQEIKENLPEWFATARSLESIDGTSAAYHMEEQRWNELNIPQEQGMTATRNYPAKSFISVQGQLYRVLHGIRNGGSIITGQNVVPITTEDYIKFITEG